MSRYGLRNTHLDECHELVVKIFEAHGWLSLSTAALGGGAPDVIFARSGKVIFVEVKSWTVPPSKRRLRPGQEKWHERWGSHVRVEVVDSEERALRLAQGVAIRGFHAED